MEGHGGVRASAGSRLFHLVEAGRPAAAAAVLRSLYRDVILSLAAGAQVAAVGGEGVAGRQWEHRLETDGDGEEAVTAEA